ARGAQLEALQPGRDRVAETTIDVELERGFAGAGHAQPRVNLAGRLQQQRPRRRAHREIFDVLAELPLQERPRVGSRQGHDVALDPGRERLGHRADAARRAAVIRRAAGTAASRACALLRHSRSSCSGTESTTMPAPASTDARPSGCTTIVRMAMAVSTLPEKSRYPTTPAYGPRFTGSSASMISIARTFGAPDTVPAGSVARSTSTGPSPARREPDTCDVRCMTWL